MPFERTYTNEQFLQAVKDATYMTEVLRKLGLTNGSVKSAKKLLNELKPDTSHWIDANVLKLNNFKTNLVEIPIEEILVENSKYIYSNLKNKMIKHGLLVEQCCECKLGPEWNKKPLILQLDHVNGVHNDNRIENLRLLCPNCHSQTETFCGKIAKIRLPRCKYCDNFVKDKRSKTCRNCFLSQDYRTISWPKNEELVSLLNSFTFAEVAKLLNVNETTIRKRVKKKQLNSLIKRCK